MRIATARDVILSIVLVSLINVAGGVVTVMILNWGKSPRWSLVVQGVYIVSIGVAILATLKAVQRADRIIEDEEGKKRKQQNKELIRQFDRHLRRSCKSRLK